MAERVLPPGRVQALAVTAAALFVYQFGSRLPLYGIDPKALSGLLSAGGLGLERLSLFTLGVIPLYSSLLLVELARLLAPWFGRWAAANPQSLVRGARGLALGFAAFQAMGIATALEQAARVVPEPGLLFRFVTVASIVTAVGFTMWLADEVTRRGLGSGFWVMLCVPLLAGLPKTIATGSELQRMGMLSPSSWLAAAVYLALGTAAIVKLDRARLPALPDLRLTSVWSPILAYTVLGWFTGLVYAIHNGGTSDPRALWYGPGQPIYLALLAGLVVLFAILRLVRTEPAADGLARDHVIRLGVIGGGMQAAIVVAGELMQQVAPIAINGMWLIILVTLMLRVRDGLKA